MSDLRTELIKYVNSNLNCFARYLPGKPHLWDLVKDVDGRTVPEKVYNYLSPGVRQLHQTCKTCGAKTDRFITVKLGYRIFCSNKCSMNDPEQKAKSTAGFRTEAAIKKREATLFERYGTNAMVIVNREAIKQSSLERYGVDNPLKSALAQKWRENFYEKTYGVKNPFQNPTVQAKIKQSLLDKYGVCTSLELVDWSKVNVTKPHQEIIDYIKQLDSSLELRINDRKLIAPLEIDIYIPSKNLGIEYNELVWHSEKFGNKDPRYHLNKTELCEKAGVKLIHLFSDEWKNSKDLVKGRLAVALGHGTRVHARRCKVVQVDSATEMKLLREWHQQGPLRGSVRLGLELEGNLIALMTFCKSRFSKHHDWELLRYCSKVGVTVVGGASKLLADFRRKYSGSIISYADRRWSNGKMYRELGFAFKHASPPSYFYILPDMTRMNRIAAQKHKLAELLGEMFDPILSEAENMQQAGFDRIWDCGTYAFELV